MGTEGKLKRYIGNLADDTKDLFDDILDRGATTPHPDNAGIVEPSLAEVSRQVTELTRKVDEILVLLHLMQRPAGPAVPHPQ